MYCPECGRRSEVWESRRLENYVWRQRWRPKCQIKFTTWETTTDPKKLARLKEDIERRLQDMN